MKSIKSSYKVIAVLLVISILLFSGCSAKTEAENETSPTDSASVQPSYAVKAENVKKAETVYVTMDSQGAVQNTIVTDWLHTDSAETFIEDVSDLTDITNIKSDVTPKQDGENLIWNMPTTDLYYRGTTDKTLPFSISIKYYLNDVEMTPDEIAGQSGRVKISITMTNNMFKTENIGGKSVKVYNPVVALGGMILSESQFQNISVENGQAIGDGSKEIAMLVGMPGLNETLGISELHLEGLEEIEFKDSFTITADTTDFTLGNMYFAVLPLSSLNSSITVPNSVEELKRSLTQLKELEAAIKTIDPNGFITSLINNPSQLNGLVDMVNEAVSLYQDNKTLLELLPKYMTEENIKTLTELGNGSEQSDLRQLIELLSNPAVQQFLKVLPGSAKELNQILPVMKQLSEDMEKPEVQQAINNLPETLKRLSALQEEMNNNKEIIEGLSALLTEDNINLLSSVLESSNSAELVNKLEKYGVITDNSEDLIDRVNAMLKYSKEFGIFTKSAPNTETSLMFVMKTAPIKRAEAAVEQTDEADESWLQKFFG